jgi:CHAT domain-containing protein
LSRALPAESVLVEFARFRHAAEGRDEYVAIVLRAGEPEAVQLVPLGQATPIDRLVADFRNAVTSESKRGPGLQKTPLKADLAPRRSLRSRLNSWLRGAGQRDLGAVPQPEPLDLSAGARLRQVLFDPLLPAFEGRTQLLIAPDGDLTRLPFEVLPTADGCRVIDRYRISYVTTGRDVLRFGAASLDIPADPLVVADPDFDLAAANPGTVPEIREHGGKHSRDLDRSTLRFGRLHGTRNEGEQVAALLGVQPCLDAEALEARVKACRSPRILHLATHGYFLADQPRDRKGERSELEAVSFSDGSQLDRFFGAALENPLLRSGVALAGVNSWLKGGSPPAEAEDGLLTAEDVSALNLLDTEMVVLSACETGLGAIHVGEGVFGLRRAFVLAGARTLVMSLWKVPDQQTQELMQMFYRHILHGQSRADALRQAQLALKARCPDPLYWGAFICQGDPGPLRARSRTWS